MSYRTVGPNDFRIRPHLFDWTRNGKEYSDIEYKVEFRSRGNCSPWYLLDSYKTEAQARQAIEKKIEKEQQRDRFEEENPPYIWPPTTRGRSISR